MWCQTTFVRLSVTPFMGHWTMKLHAPSVTRFAFDAGFPKKFQGSSPQETRRIGERGSPRRTMSPPTCVEGANGLEFQNWPRHVESDADAPATSFVNTTTSGLAVSFCSFSSLRAAL